MSEIPPELLEVIEKGIIPAFEIVARESNAVGEAMRRVLGGNSGRARSSPDAPPKDTAGGEQDAPSVGKPQTKDAEPIPVKVEEVAKEHTEPGAVPSPAKAVEQDAPERPDAPPHVIEQHIAGESNTPVAPNVMPEAPPAVAPEPVTARGEESIPSPAIRQDVDDSREETPLVPPRDEQTTHTPRDEEPHAPSGKLYDFPPTDSPESARSAAARAAVESRRKEANLRAQQALQDEHDKQVAEQFGPVPPTSPSQEAPEQPGHPAFNLEDERPAPDAAPVGTTAPKPPAKADEASGKPTTPFETVGESTAKSDAVARDAERVGKDTPSSDPTPTYESIGESAAKGDAAARDAARASKETAPPQPGPKQSSPDSRGKTIGRDIEEQLPVPNRRQSSPEADVAQRKSMPFPRDPQQDGTQAPALAGGNLGGSLPNTDKWFQRLTELTERLVEQSKAKGDEGTGKDSPQKDLTAGEQEVLAKKRKAEGLDSPRDPNPFAKPDDKDQKQWQAKLGKQVEAVPGVGPLAKAGGNLVEALGGAGGGAAKAGGAASEGGAGAIAGMLGPIGSGLGAVATGIGAVVGAAQAVVGVFNQVVGAATPFVAAFSPATILVMDQAFGDLAATIGRALVPVLETATAIVRQFGSMLLPVTTALEPVMRSLMDTIGGVVSQMMSGMQPLFDAIAPVAAACVSVFSALMDLLAPMFAFNDICSVVVGGGLRALAGMVGVLVEAFRPVILICQQIGDVFSAVALVMSAVIETIAGMFGGAGTEIKDFCDKLRAAFQELIKAAILVGARLAMMFGGKSLVDNLVKGVEKRGGANSDNTGQKAATNASFKSFADFGKTVATSASIASGAGEERKTDDFLKDILGELQGIQLSKETVVEWIKLGVQAGISGIKDAAYAGAGSVLKTAYDYSPVGLGKKALSKLTGG